MVHARIAVAAVLLLLFSSSASAEVRPISGAERAAVEIAAAYLSGGPSAITDKLAASSPLRKLSANEQLAELEVRLGPPGDADWELQTIVPALKDRMAAFTVNYPAGFEDHLIFEMVSEGGAYKLQDVRFLAMPSDRKPLFPPRAIAEPADLAAAANTPRIPWSAIAGIFAAALGIAASFAARRRALFVAAISFAALLVIGAAALVVVTQRPVEKEPVAPAAATPSADAGPTRLASLLPLRRALAAGKGNVDAEHASVDRAQGRGAIADLWKIQSQLLQTQTSAAKTALAAFASPSDTPLAEILRAQIALLENDQVTAALAFEHAVNLGPGRDTLWLENANILYSLGFEERAESYYRRLEQMGSRDATAYYTLATLAAASGDEAGAEQYLRKAWQMAPVAREALVDAAVLWSTLRRPGMVEAIAMSAPGEPLVGRSPAMTAPIVLPVDAEATTTGDLLRVTIRGQELRVPQGASLATPDTRIVEATESRAAEEARSIADLPMLLASATGAAAYAQPALRERVTGTAHALAQRKRWNDIVTLTEKLSPSSEHVPPEIFYLRTVALQRLQRKEEASRLLQQIAQSPVLQRRRDADALAQFAELFAAQDLFDAAVRMYDRSQQIRPNPFIDDRVRQILMNKRLATRYAVATTPHFEIHYPDDVPPASATQLGAVLEREFQRLQSWIPASDFRPVVVNMVWWQEFRSTYTGNDFVLGFYNGKITVPFAGVDAEDPEITAILAHELSHAMIAQATADQAPRWFQEGFAKRLETRSFHENAFNMYDDAKLLPISLLDAVLGSSPDPELISAAYVIAQTDIRFFEQKYGRASLQKLMTAFREGGTTAEAIERVCGKPLASVELELRQWGRGSQRIFTN
jgi:tetratricopeptide (TPR) repeat protein